MKAKKIIIPVSIVAGIAVIGVAVAALGSAASTVSYAETIKIQEKNIENRISVSGTIESADKQKVYSRLSYPVEKINVSVGDAVKKGDVLCTISTEDLQQQILQQQASVDSSGINSEYSLSEAEQNYADALEAFEKGENSSIISASKAITQAEKNLESAKRDEKIGVGTNLPTNIKSADEKVQSAKEAYEKSVEAYEKAEKELLPENYPIKVRQVYEDYLKYKENLDTVKNDKFNGELARAQKAYDEIIGEYQKINTPGSNYDYEYIERITEKYTKAKTELETIKKTYDLKTLEEQVKTYEDQHKLNIEALEDARDAAKDAMEAAEKAYNSALDGYENTQQNTSNTEESYGIAVKNAEEALKTAKKDYELTVQRVEAELASLKKQAERQRTISGLNDPQVIILQNLKDKLEYAVITAPCDGIVTAVNAEEGVAAAGALFVIEDLSNLKVSASVGEYDIPFIDEGMSAIIKCDAISGEEFSGKVTDVAPTAASVATANSGASYLIETDIDENSGKLMAGMSANVSIISDKRENALTVTYDAITTDENGNDVIYAAVKDENGVYKVKVIQVKVGLETDYEIEIISDEISSGMFVLTDTTMLSDGDVVMINDTEEQVAE